MDHGFLPRNADSDTIARFLKENPAIDKEILGEFLGSNKPKNIEILQKFMDTFDFADTRIDLALMTAMSSFRMPGEAQIISRVIEAFSNAYYKPESVFANSDAVFVLAYSIIMLNTDQHNPGVKNPMTKENYFSNVRNCNGGSNFPEGLLNDIFDNISSNPIKVFDVVPR
jgi:brefeldin A-resistance guanine nucleotide exchange factor 1